jgi:hypothetical protein
MLSNLSNETMAMLEAVDRLHVRTATLRQQVQESIGHLHVLIEDAAILRDELREALRGDGRRKTVSSPFNSCPSLMQPPKIRNQAGE